MIVILSEIRFREKCAEIQAALAAKYPDIPANCLDPTSQPIWPAPETWADVLVVPFDDQPLSSSARLFVDSVLARSTKVFVLPVAISDKKAPPPPLDSIKALPWEDDNFSRGCMRIGARLGLSLRSRNHTIFISYRAVDGTEVATQIEAFLKGEGYNVWRDDSKDAFDGQTSIPPGEEVQREIEENLKPADMVLLLDTPRACESPWINLEVNLANGNLIPVLPVLFRKPDERILCSRFRALATLQRNALVELNAGDTLGNITQPGLLKILQEMEEYLCDIFQRRLRVPHCVQRDFTKFSYEWAPRDRFVYEAVQRAQGRIRLRVFSHCSFFDGIYDPSLCAFIRHLRALTARANYALYIYDGALIPSAQLRVIEKAAELEDSSEVILLHHQELLAALQSNFTQVP